MKHRIAIINGPNLNLIGQREQAIYGNVSLSALQQHLLENWSSESLALEFFQSNHEGQLIDYIQGLSGVSGLVVNPGGYTHTSISIRDALLAVELPFVEVHISNVHAREPFRRLSYFSDIAQATICGFGLKGYEFAIEFMVDCLNSTID